MSYNDPHNLEPSISRKDFNFSLNIKQKQNLAIQHCKKSKKNHMGNVKNLKFS